MVRVILLIIHILAVMLAFGASSTVGLWASRAQGDRAQLRFTLETLMKLDRLMIDPGYTIGGITGIILVQYTGIPWSTTWVMASFVLWFVALGLSHGLLRPAMRKQLAALDDSGPESAEFVAFGMRAQTAGMALTVIAVIIVVLMVWKPI